MGDLVFPELLVQPCSFHWCSAVVVVLGVRERREVLRRGEDAAAQRTLACDSVSTHLTKHVVELGIICPYVLSLS